MKKVKIKKRRFCSIIHKCELWDTLIKYTGKLKTSYISSPKNVMEGKCILEPTIGKCKSTGVTKVTSQNITYDKYEEGYNACLSDIIKIVEGL